MKFLMPLIISVSMGASFAFAMDPDPTAVDMQTRYISRATSVEVAEIMARPEPTAEERHRENQIHALINQTIEKAHNQWRDIAQQRRACIYQLQLHTADLLKQVDGFIGTQQTQNKSAITSAIGLFSQYPSPENFGILEISLNNTIALNALRHQMCSLVFSDYFKKIIGPTYSMGASFASAMDHAPTAADMQQARPPLPTAAEVAEIMERSELTAEEWHRENQIYALINQTIENACNRWRDIAQQRQTRIHQLQLHTNGLLEQVEIFIDTQQAQNKNLIICAKGLCLQNPSPENFGILERYLNNAIEFNTLGHQMRSLVCSDYFKQVIDV